MNFRLVTVIAVAGALSAEVVHATPRLLGGVHLGSAGAELVIAAEWDIKAATPQRLRPEVLLNDGRRPGIGCSYTFALARESLTDGHELYVGPRVVYHNSKDDDFEFGAAAFYRFPIVPSQPGKHTIDAIGGLGLLDHRDDWQLGVTVGAAYGYQF